MVRSLSLAFLLTACATGSNLDSGTTGEGGVVENGGAAPNLSGSGGNGGTSSTTSSNQTSSQNVSSSTVGPTTSSSSVGGGSSSSSQTSSSQTSGPASSSTSSGGTMCEPEAPSAGCGPAMHCVPTLDVAADPTCEAAGSGGTYELCVDRGDCAPETECVNDGLDACCMTWCILGGSDCNVGETCTELGAPVYANGQSYGVCWDGYPCVI